VADHPDQRLLTVLTVDQPIGPVEVPAERGQRLADPLSHRHRQPARADRLLQRRQGAQPPGQRHLSAVQRGLLLLHPG